MKIHCMVVADVMSELTLENHPGVRLLEASDFEERPVHVPAPVVAPKRKLSEYLKEVLRLWDLEARGRVSCMDETLVTRKPA